MILTIPPMRRCPVDATPEQRRALFDQYVRELRLLNPHLFNPDGSVCSFWQRLRSLWAG